VGSVRDVLHFTAWDVINTSAANHRPKKKDGITDDLKTEAEIIEVNLGKKKKWVASGKTQSGKVARRKLYTDTSVAMKASCMILAHRHQLKRT